MERSKKRKAPGDSPAGHSGTRRESPRQTPEPRQPCKRPRVDSAGISKLSETASSERSEIYSSTRSGSFSNTGSSNNIPAAGCTRRSNSSSASTNNINHGSNASKKINTTRSNSCRIPNKNKTNDGNEINAKADSSYSQFASNNQKGGTDDYSKPSCSYKSSSTKRSAKIFMDGDNSSTSASTITGNFASNTGCSSSSDKTTGGGCMSSTTSDGSSKNNTDTTTGTCTSDTSNTSNSRSSSSSKRELKNLQDAWSTVVSPFRTRSQSEGGPSGTQKTRRQINFTSDDTSSSCYPPSSPSTAKSISSDLLSVMELEASHTSLNQTEQTLKDSSRDIVYFNSASQESNSECSVEHLHVSSSSTISSETKSAVTICKGKTSGAVSSDISLAPEVPVSSNATLQTLSSVYSQIVSVPSGRSECLSSESYEDFCKSDVSIVNNVGGVPLHPNEDRLFSSISSLFNTESEDSSNTTIINKAMSNNQPSNPVSKRQLRSLRLSSGVQATTSKAASLDGIFSDACFSKHVCSSEDFANDSVSGKLQIIESTGSSINGNVPARLTRSRSMSGDTAGFPGNDTVIKKPRLSKLVTILTSEHDYFKKDSSPLISDLQVSSSTNTTGHESDAKTDKTYTIYTIESSVDADSGHECRIPGSSSTEDKLSMARSDNALSGIPSDREDTFYNSPLPNSLDSNAALSDDFIGNKTALLPSAIEKGGSSTNVSDDGKNLGFDLNDFVIRRRRLRSESTKDELWEGLPAITPFRKHLNKMKSEGRDEIHVDGECLPDGDECSPQLKSGSDHSLKQSSSSTTDLISEIDSILSDTPSSSCPPLITGDTDDITMFFEDTWDNQSKYDTEKISPNRVQQIIDKDIDCNTLESVDNKNVAKFSSDSLSHTSPVTLSESEIKNKDRAESGMSEKDFPCQVTSQLIETPSDVSTTPAASRPESIWWSEKSEDWAIFEGNQLGISPIVKSSSDDNSKEQIDITEDSGQERDSEIRAILDDSCAAVDDSVFKEITSRNGTERKLTKDRVDSATSTEEIRNLNRSNIGEKFVSNQNDHDSSSGVEAISIADSDGDSHLGPFRIRDSNNEKKDSQADDKSVLSVSKGSPVSSKSESTSSSDFVLWSKRKDKRKLSFPKIVLRKCKDTVRYNTFAKSKESKNIQTKQDPPKTPEKRRNSGRRKTKEPVSPSDDSPTPKRSARLMKRVDALFPSQTSRSTDFVYTPLKREESKTKSTSQASSQEPNSSSVKKTKCNRNTKHSEVDTQAEVVNKAKYYFTSQTTQARSDTASSSVSGTQTTEVKATHPKTRNGVLKKKHETTSQERSLLDSHQSPAHNMFRRRKGPAIDEELLTNPVIDKHACVLWSSEHRRHFQLTHPDATPADLDEMLRHQWSSELTPQEKMKYFTRARDAVRDEDKHAQRNSRDTRRSGRSGNEKKAKEDEMSSLERFTRLKIKRQKDLLTKWLHFFQKVLSRKEYAEFIEDVKQGILEAEDRDKPNKSRGLTSKIFSHKKLLFLKMNNLKDHVMKQYFHRLQRQKELHRLAFDILITRLIQGKPCAFIKGCRSRVLTTILQDLKELEYDDSVAVFGYPISTSSFTNLYKEIVETVDSCMFKDDPLESGQASDTKPASNITSATSKAYEKPPENESVASEPSSTNIRSFQTQAKYVSPPRGSSCQGTDGFEWYDKQVSPDVMSRLLDGLSTLPSLPVLQHNTLDTMFLPPPTWVPGSSGPIPLTVKTIPVYPRTSAVPGWMSSGKPYRPRYSCTPRMSGQGRPSQYGQGLPSPSCSARMPGSTRLIDLPQRMSGSQVPVRGVSMLPGTYRSVSGTTMIPRCYRPIRDVMYCEARDAFNRSFTSTTDSCCYMDSPACVLSTWIAADKTNMQ